MRFSQLFAPTLKEAPKDAILRSHQYLIRAGFIEQIGSGIYNLLPLGKIVLDNIKNIIKEEMDKIGAQEVSLGFITPAEFWEKSGRLEQYGKELLRFKDRKEAEFILGPTYEEAMTLLVKNKIKSYKNLPLHLYQIHLKFRDEIRPRFGLIRAREFVMKDGYSFHESHEDLVREFNIVEQTYSKIFTHLGLNFRAVLADSGAIGGSGSKEFMVLSQNGEDDLCICDTCSYAANKETATRKPRIPKSTPPQANLSDFKTPGANTIELLCDFFKVDPYYTLKCIAKKAILKNNQQTPAFFFLRGCDALNDIKALNALRKYHGDDIIDLSDISKEELENYGLPCGFIGPYSLKHLIPNALVCFDNETKDAKNLICGANKKDYHIVGADLSTFENLQYYDLIEVEEGDICSQCGNGVLKITNGIEVGHIFQLGTKYSKALNATFLNKNGVAEPFIMGCYGIGVSRLISAIVEQNADDRGIIWTDAVSPFRAHIIISNIKDDNQMQCANEIYEQLTKSGIKTLLDDRDERYGIKITDFELLGNLFGIIIGKGLKEDRPFIELVNRRTLEKTLIYIKEKEFMQQLKDILSIN